MWNASHRVTITERKGDEAEMIEVAAFTSGRNVPSSRFRVRQYIQPLAECGIIVREYCPLVDKFAAPLHPKVDFPLRTAKLMSRAPGILLSRRADLVWMEREFITGRATWERFLKQPRVLDVDDAIWLHAAAEEDFSLNIARGCAGVIAGNSYIRAHYERGGIHAWLLPTGVDTDRWKPDEAAKGKDSTLFVVGWTGTSSNLEYLYQIEEPLGEFLRQVPHARIKVVCDSPPRFRLIPADKTFFVPWSPEGECEAVQGMDIGLMPLPDTRWALGKCSLKMLLYMATGIPVVASPIGTNRDIFDRGAIGFAASTPRDWFESLLAAYEDPQLRLAMGEVGRQIVLNSFSTSVLSRRLASIFREILPSSENQRSR